MQMTLRYHRVAQSDQPGVSSVKVFCPKCNEVYMPRATRHQNLDGVYFGTSFPHMLFAVYPEV